MTVSVPAPRGAGAGMRTAQGQIRELFRPNGTDRVGVELELFAHRVRSREFPISSTRPGGIPVDSMGAGLFGRVTLEPGGQLELSSAPARDLRSLESAVGSDLRQLEERADALGLRLSARLDPDDPPVPRVLRTPRYDAMESYFERWSPNGMQMMRETVSLQVNVDTGRSEQEVRSRWELLHAIGPALVAAFANSPTPRGAADVWKSDRLRIWSGLDPARTGAPIPAGTVQLSDAYTEWALNAPLMLARRNGDDWSVPGRATFADWIRVGAGVVPERSTPDDYDLHLHLSTLFPFVRPRGYFEVRYLDMPPTEWWLVPTAVIVALLAGPEAMRHARMQCIDVEGAWLLAARVGLEDAALRRSASALLELAAAILRADRQTVAIAERVDAYRRRWTLQGLCPADEGISYYENTVL